MVKGAKFGLGVLLLLRGEIQFLLQGLVQDRLLIDQGVFWEQFTHELLYFI